MRSPVGRERMSREREALGLTGPGPWEEGWVDPYSMEVDGEITVDEEVLVSRERDIDAILDQDGVEVELEDFEAEKPMKV